MSKRRNQSLIDSDSSESESETNIESELLSLAKKRKRPDENGEDGRAEGTSDSSSGSESQSGTDSDSNSESDWDADERRANQQQGNVIQATKTNEDTKGIASPDELNVVKEASPYNDKLIDKPVSDQEEGEVSDSNNEEEGELKLAAKAAGTSGSESDYSDSSSESEFDDGYDENLMGDDEDRKRLNNLSEKERETEIFKRIEQRDFMRTRWEIERKLKLARRGEKAYKSRSGHKSSKKSGKKYLLEKQDPSSIAASALAKLDALTAAQKAETKVESNNDKPASTTVDTDTHDDEEDKVDIDVMTGKELSVLDHKERSKERKKNVEMNRTDDKRSSAMALLKAKREGKAKREEEEAKRQAERERDEDKELETVAGGKSNVKLKASEIYSDDSGSSDWDDDPKPTEQRSRSSSRSRSSDSESGDDKVRSRGSPVYITTREELNKIRLSRFKMERFINLPIFERTVMNCFVRISIGNNGQKPVYRVAEIVGAVETAKIYNLGKTRTNRGLRLKHGTQERVFRLEFISNQEFSETEFNKWREVCSDQNVLMPTLEMVERKQRDIQFAMNYEYKEEDVDKLIEEKNRLRNRPTNYAMRKSCLMKERDAAMIRGEYDEARKLGEEIEELESRASELDKKRSSSLSLISYINDRNRKRNVADAEKAIMEEARANRGQRISDPFTRRITQPRMGFNKQEKNESGEESSNKPISALPPKPMEALKPEDILDAPIDNGNSSNRQTTLDKEGQAAYSLYSLHDFDIDLDVVMPANSANVLPQPVAKGQQVAQRRSLNLEDYKKKRGLI